MSLNVAVSPIYSDILRINNMPHGRIISPSGEVYIPAIDDADPVAMTTQIAPPDADEPGERP